MFGLNKIKRQIKDLYKKVDMVDAMIGVIPENYGLRKPHHSEYLDYHHDRPIIVKNEIDLLNKKIDLIMKHLRISIIDVAPRPADMMVVEVTTAEEKHHE